MARHTERGSDGAGAAVAGGRSDGARSTGVTGVADALRPGGTSPPPALDRRRLVGATMGAGAALLAGTAAPPPAGTRPAAQGAPGGAAPAGVEITEFPLPAPDSLPGGITVGPDGALWFYESGAN